MSKSFCSFFVLLLFAYPAFTQVNFSSSDLPIVIIETNGQNIKDTPKIKARMGIIWNGDGNRNSISDIRNNYDGDIMIEIRGATSQGFPKKQYALETIDSLGENNNVSLLGMPEENDWILYAPYSDKSLVRNFLEYQLARDMGWYATRTKYCELILNGEYRGIYILLEKIKRDKGRVDISNLRPEDIIGDQLTGGYIIKIDKNKGDDTGGWNSDYPKNTSLSDKLYYQYHYPKTDDINNQQKEYIKSFMNDFEASLESSNYKDSVNGYAKYIDFDSFVDYLILTEIGRNVDGYSLSTFLHKDRDSKDGKLKMGPVWDYNIAFGNVDYNNAELTSGWRLMKPYRDIPFWWKKFVRDKRFISKLENRWKTLRTKELSEERIFSIIDSAVNIVDEAKDRNFQKWKILGVDVWPNFFVGKTHEEEIDYLKDWISNRLLWMDENIRFGVFDGEIISDQGEYALSFDGVDDYVDLGNDDEISIAGKGLTLEAWVKVNKFRANSYQGAIISKDQMASGNDNGYVLRCGGEGQIDFVLGSGSWNELESPVNSISVNEWTHLAATYNGMWMKLYVNGEKVAQRASSHSIQISNTNLFIGTSPSAINRTFNGLIDEVRIWNIARTEQEIQQTMNITLDEGYTYSEFGLAGYWRFDEGEGNFTKNRITTSPGYLGDFSPDDNSQPIWVSSDAITNIEREINSNGKHFHLNQNYPNPFNPETTITYSLPENGMVNLFIYNSIGQKVYSEINQSKVSGIHQQLWKANNLASGVYFIQINFVGSVSNTNSTQVIKSLLLN